MIRVSSISILLCSFVFTSCETKNIKRMTEFTESEQLRLNAEPEQLSETASLLENNIIKSNIGEVTGLNYLYSCEGFNDSIELDQPAVVSQSRSNTWFKYTNLKNGVVAKSKCRTKNNIKYPGVQQLLLWSCAKSAGMNAFNRVYDYEHEKIEYIQWCILEESSNSIEILEFFKVE